MSAESQQIFLNQLNTSRQRKEENVLILSDKSLGFKRNWIVRKMLQNKILNISTSPLAWK